MKKFEYTSTLISGAKNPTKELNDFGNEGWVVVDMYFNKEESIFVVYFMREKE